MKLDEVVTINTAAASAAAQALGRMTHRNAGVRMLNARLIQLSKERPDIDLSGRVAGVYLPITGGLAGVALLCFREPKAAALIDMVVGSPDEAARTPQLDQSAFKELGNIICGNYVTEFANRLGAKITPGLPQLVRGTFQEVCERVVELHDLETDSALVLDVEFELPAGSTMGHLLMCFETGRVIET